MSFRIRIVLAVVALLATACGAPVAEQSATTTTTEAAATTITTEAGTTTTTEATTTTARAADSELGALMASLKEPATELTSGRIEGSIEMTGMDEQVTGLSEMTIRFSTSFDTTTGDASFLIDMSSLADSVDIEELESSEDPFAGMAAAFLGEIEFRQIGDRVYLKFPFFTAMFGAETDWISMPAEDGGDLTSSFETVPSDPNQVLEAFESAAATIEDLGVENVNGVDATHYRISIDAEEMELTPEERAELEASGIFASGVIPMDIWITEEGYQVRMILEIDGSGLDVPPEESFETMRITYDMFDLNQGVVIEPPPADEVTNIEDLDGSMFGFEPEQ